MRWRALAPATLPRTAAAQAARPADIEACSPDKIRFRRNDERTTCNNSLNEMVRWAAVLLVMTRGRTRFAQVPAGIAKNGANCMPLGERRGARPAAYCE